jgi:hypothetical protein
MAEHRDPASHAETSQSMSDRIVALIVIAIATFTAVYFLIDDTPVGWAVRLAWAGAITAGAAVTVHAIRRLIS